FGVGAPKATPAGIVDKLNKEVNAALDDPKMKARIADLGGAPLLGSPADFGRLIADETAKWGKGIKFAGIKPEGPDRRHSINSVVLSSCRGIVDRCKEGRGVGLIIGQRYAARPQVWVPKVRGD